MRPFPLVILVALALPAVGCNAQQIGELRSVLTNVATLVNAFGARGPSSAAAPTPAAGAPTTASGTPTLAWPTSHPAPPGDLPTDGTSSIHVEDFVDDTFRVGENSPTNYAGDTGTVRVADASFLRGECNADGRRDLSDAIFQLGALFLGGPGGPCEDACDANDDGRLDISDPVATLQELFLGVPGEPRPPLDCGRDPTPDALTCSASGC